MPTELVFALPAGSDEISGGNLYNQKLIDALAGRHPITKVTAGECRTRVEQGEAGFYFIDTLDLGEFASFPSPRPGQYFGLLVHHLPSLEPGIDPADPALATEQLTLSRFDAFVATSAFTAEHLRARGCEDSRIWTIPPAPPMAASALPTPAPPFVFLVASNLIRRKGVLELFEHLAARVSVTDAFCIELAGRSDLDPAYANACLELARGRQLQSFVHYLGPVPYDGMMDCYRRAAGFVSVSKMETFGIALQEAKAYGLPILAVDGGYARHHFTSGQDGLLFQSIEALADELLALTRNPPRMQALFETAQRSRASSDYTWAKAAERFAAAVRAYVTSRTSRG
jgi:glycosyltransferase involved in cell wall biosynthesis